MKVLGAMVASIPAGIATALHLTAARLGTPVA